VGSVVSASLNAACIHVLSENGFDVHLLPDEPCCGALAAHANDPQTARDLAMSLVDTLTGKDVSYFISPIAGCGAQLKSLGGVLANAGAYAQKAQTIAARVRDISEFLIQVGVRPPTIPIVRTVTYHDPCHLAHAQRITDAPRKLLAMIPGINIVPLPESDMCCGAAGTYSLNQPDLSARLGQRKVRHLLQTTAQELITANIGCSLQIARHLQSSGSGIPVKHVIELLAESYG
jgi:glycolate oxidase iron-sulfur subunit